MANSVDPDEAARYEPSHLDLHCFAKVFVLVCRDESFSPICRSMVDTMKSFN